MTGKEEIKATALARIFSATVVKELALRGCSPAFARLLKESGLRLDPHSTDGIGAVFDQAFAQLKRRSHRHEYIYKAALTKKVLLGTHSLQTASMATEFRVGRCKADVVIFNGTGTVYEIKSERDSLTRLADQVEAYSRVFAAVNVIVGENHLYGVEACVPDYVGVMVLSNRFQISTLRAAVDDPDRTDPAAIFDSINQREAGLMLQAVGVSLPEIPNTQRYGALREKFLTLDPKTAHRQMVECLKRTRSLSPLSSVLDSVPESLYAAIISTPMNRREQDRLIGSLRTPICEAVAWA